MDFKSIWKPNNILLNDFWKCVKLSDNENGTCPNWWDTAKALL